jgi:SAM-dependent methyltransferase
MQGWISGDCGSFLDVGCNAGLLTCAAAGQGLFAVGIDQLQVAIDSARKMKSGSGSLTFMCHSLSPENIGIFPTFDAVTLLSVNHQWVSKWGEGVVAEMLASLLSKMWRVFFFETAAVPRKYGSNVPAEFGAGNGSEIAWVLALLTRIAPSTYEVIHLGGSRTPDEDEIIRELFAVEMA